MDYEYEGWVHYDVRRDRVAILEEEVKQIWTYYAQPSFNYTSWSLMVQQFRTGKIDIYVDPNSTNSLGKPRATAVYRVPARTKDIEKAKALALLFL